MKNNKIKYKIAFVGDSLSGGGAEKVQATLSKYFSENNIEVHNIIFYDEVSYDFGGSVYNLGLLPNRTKWDKVKKIWALRRYIRDQNFDQIIDFRYRVNFLNEFLIRFLAFNSSAIYSIRSGIIDYSLPKNRWLTKVLYSKNPFISVSKAIENQVRIKYQLDISTIYNPIIIDEFAVKSQAFEVEESNYILAVGRMNDRVKQMDHLIYAYAKSTLPQNEISLVILGEGKFRPEYEQLVKNLNLDNKVYFKARVQNPFPYYKKAIFTVLTSKNEGFPNVLIESLGTGTPVISYDCFSGPSEIITNYENGLLVENQSIDKLTSALNKMISDQNLYQTCKNNSQLSVQKFALAKIGKQWLETFKMNE